MTKQEMLGTLKEYLSRLKTEKGEIHPKTLREELRRVRDDISYLREEMRRTRDDIHSLREDILSSHFIKNKSYENHFNKTYARGGK